MRDGSWRRVPSGKGLWPTNPFQGLRLRLKLRLHLIALMQQLQLQLQLHSRHPDSPSAGCVFHAHYEPKRIESTRARVKLKFPLLRERPTRPARKSDCSNNCGIAENILCQRPAGRPLCRQFDCPPMWRHVWHRAPRLPWLLQMLLLLMLLLWMLLLLLCWTAADAAAWPIVIALWHCVVLLITAHLSGPCSHFQTRSQLFSYLSALGEISKQLLKPAAFSV